MNAEVNDSESEIRALLELRFPSPSWQNRSSATQDAAEFFALPHSPNHQQRKMRLDEAALRFNIMDSVSLDSRRSQTLSTSKSRMLTKFVRKDLHDVPDYIE